MKSDLIASLVAELKPVRPLQPLLHCGQIFLFSNFVIAVALCIFLEHRSAEDFVSDQLGLLSDVMLFVTSFFSFSAAAVLSVPGHPKHRFVRVLIVPVLAVAGALFVIMAVFHGESALQDGLAWKLGRGCSFTIGALSLVPALLSLWFMRKWAPTSQGLVGALLGMGVALSGAVALSFSCSWSEPVHLLVYHFSLPAAVFAVIFNFLGKSILRW